jgi:cytochrome c-type biogenesis protein CcmF
LVATKGVPEARRAARHFFYASYFLIACATFLLAYAFQMSDFSLRYVTHYSDRATDWPYRLAALWAGQDGSLLWWTFTLGTLCSLCLWRLRDRALLLEPYIAATFAAVVGFFLLIMLFAADPFFPSIGPILFDGQGLNPLLRNPWMLVHPPVLYIGMVGWAVPFGFAVAALFTRQLSEQWLNLARPWVLFVWGALAMGNVLGMIWSYEVLGWGGYWAWDPVENASFLPMLSGTAYLHSAIAQQRRGIFKGWSIGLLCLTFFMTVFGTFLTRSGLIASVHAFSRSGMAPYFVVLMALIAALCGALLWSRRQALRATNADESLQGRSVIFWLINIAMTGMLVFVAAATLFPLASEAVRGETVTVGASFYNRWIAPLAVAMLVLLGLCLIIPWRAQDSNSRRRALMLPTISGVTTALLHLFFGAVAGFPALIPLSQEVTGSPNAFATIMARLYAPLPLLIFAASAFAVTAHLQELVKIAKAGTSPSTGLAPWRWLRSIARARRLSGATLVHVGAVLMCVGITGSLYDRESQAALKPGERVSAGGFQVRFDRPRMEPGPTRNALFADLTVLGRGQVLGTLTPAKFFYDKPPETTTTEVAIRMSLSQDIYVILNSINPANRVGTFRVIVRPLVVWIWIGARLMLLGTIVAFSAAQKSSEVHVSR